MKFLPIILFAAAALSTQTAFAERAAETAAVEQGEDADQKAQADFKARYAKGKCKHAAQALALAKNDDERRALTFLYAYMPRPDVTDYAPEYYAAQTACALRARREMPWGKDVPEREWRHFVLPVRVNNENLDTFRTACYEELKARVQGLAMREAALEVNHWCHEYVTYKPSDARTSSPLASMRTATGRCGEESTFTVAALRAVGIPARQVYTPRWAHTDDNHAWVEVYVDGRWYFLGACEPEPVLNLGWFNKPASRGMLMHTKVFGRYDGPEDVIARTACYTEINVTANYAETARSTVQVLDSAGQPAAGVRVEFKLYNYGELYTVFRTRTDASGRASILSGLGDLVAWATDGEHYGFAQVTASKDALATVRLNRRAGEQFVEEFKLTPPRGKNNVPKVSPEATALNLRRLAHEDSIRTAYVKTFPDSAETAAFCQSHGLDFAAVRPLMAKACGNWQALEQTLCAYPEQKTIATLRTLSDKDLRDFSPTVLADHLTATPDAPAAFSAEAKTLYYKYVACPRIANELLTPWRSFFAKNISKKEAARFRAAPADMADKVRRLPLDTLWNPQGYCESPASAFTFGTTDRKGKALLFVAMARSLGIPARIDEVTGKVQYLASAELLAAGDEENLPWQTVQLAAAAQSPAAPQGTLRLAYEPRRYMENPGYYYQFTLSRLADGLPVLQNYPEDATTAQTFQKGVKTDAGDYLLASGTRLADGSVLARLAAFSVTAGGETEVPLVMREDKEAVQVIGSFNSENRYFDLASGKEQSVLAHTGRGYFVTGLIRANHEPTNHVLHDLEKLRGELEAWGRPILLLFASQEEWQRFEKNRAEFTALPSTLSFGIDSSGAVARDLFGGTLAQGSELPLIVLGDTFNRVVFASQGYTIGLGEQIKNTVSKIGE